MQTRSSNTAIHPISTEVNQSGHLVVGQCDTVELAQQFGTPLWIIDEQSIISAIESYKSGLRQYPDRLILYAGKAFLCLAMCHLINKLGLGLDVVSEGELFTAMQSGFPAEKIYMHGNNKSAEELQAGLEFGDVKIIVDNLSELNMLIDIAGKLKRRASILFRVIPGVEPDTHQHIKTGHEESKFGIPLEELIPLMRIALQHPEAIHIVGIHAHIGSQAKELAPFLETVDILADTVSQIKETLGLEIKELDVGGGLGIAYTDKDKLIAIDQWAQGVSAQVQSAFAARNLKLPRLLVEPGRSIIGTAGLTLYRAGHKKVLPSGKTYLAVDGGMADNPRPITYQALYTAAIANRMNAAPPDFPLTLVGKYCESGDIIIEKARLAADSGDLIAVFGTGAYNFSMASNYNRSPRPACVIVADGKAEIIIERETQTDLLRQDRVPKRLLE